jgi:hypothetical protein
LCVQESHGEPEAVQPGRDDPDQEAVWPAAARPHAHRQGWQQKKPTQKTPPKKPTKNVFFSLVFFYFNFLL